jgi:organic hydroperoxide reductase OsmC/OhrA
MSDTPTAAKDRPATARSAKLHGYDLALAWEGNEGSGTSSYTGYGRRFRLHIDGKADLLGSADPAFRGEPELHNPEELLLAAVASCHMLSYLALCARAGISVVAYADAAHGTLALTAAGGHFQEIVLRPRVTVARGSDAQAAADLHARAHDLCFIANSCNFPVRHQAEVVIE